MEKRKRKTAAEARVESRAKRAAKIRKAVKNAEDVVYTSPKPFNRNRFLLHLLTIAAVVVALALCLSIFFRVETILVSGSQQYSAWDIRTASGIEEGDNLFMLSKAGISGKIMAALPYVQTVQIGRELPDTIKIHVTEVRVTYSIADESGHWWLMDSDGKVIDSVDSAQAEDYTTILGVQLSDPIPGQQAVAVDPVSDDPQLIPSQQDPSDPISAGDPTGSLIPAPEVVFGKDYLDAALTIVQQLEKEGMIGQMTTVDVTNLADVQMWYGHRFQILLGDIGGLEHKTTAVVTAIGQLSQYQTGVLDASFTIYPDQVILSKFS